jgi:hypothetical protein
MEQGAQAPLRQCFYLKRFLPMAHFPLWPACANGAPLELFNGAKEMAVNRGFAASFAPLNSVMAWGVSEGSCAIDFLQWREWRKLRKV